MSDTSGIYHLADGERVESNLDLDTAAWRPILNALNRAKREDES